MKVLVACEESQTVCKAFRALGHDAYSCDLLPCSGGHPEWHIQCDVRELLSVYYDLVIFHPVCRYLAQSGVQWLHTDPGRWDKLKQAIAFFQLRHKFNASKVATENPVPHGYARKYIGACTQYIQPWQFGHKQMKRTGLWLEGLPLLTPTNIVGPPPKDKKERYKWQDCWTASPGPEREKLRSKTFPGIAMAMALQWGNL